MKIFKVLGAAALIGSMAASASALPTATCPTEYPENSGVTAGFDTVTLSVSNPDPFALSCAGSGDTPQTEKTFITANGMLIAKRETPGSDTDGPVDASTVFTFGDGVSWDGAKPGSSSPLEFSFSQIAGYTNLKLLFKFGTGNTTPSWIAFDIENVDFDAEWYTTANNGLSHVSVIGAVPLPATSLLLLGLMGAGGVAAWRKKRQTA